jgi:hypothetical protein
VIGPVVDGFVPGREVKGCVFGVDGVDCPCEVIGGLLRVRLLNDELMMYDV